MRKNFNSTKGSLKSNNFSNTMSRTSGSPSRTSYNEKFNDTILTKQTKNDNNLFTKFKNYPDYSFTDSERKGMHNKVFSTHETFIKYE